MLNKTKKQARPQGKKQAPQKDGTGLHLAVDIGNTNTVIGLFKGASLLRRWRLSTRRDATVDEIGWSLRGLVEAHEGKGKIRAVALASVVPPVEDSWVQALEEIFGLAPHILDYSNCLGLKLDYEIPRQIGADRLANVMGAQALGYREGVIIDLGTATTFDIFSNNTYWGGIICPGILSSMKALAQNASKLAEVELRWPSGIIGRNTDDAIRSGMLFGTLGQVEFLLEKVLAEKPMKSPVVIATGGLAGLLQVKSKVISLVEPDLTLIGLNFLLTQGKVGILKKGKKTGQ